MAKKKKVPEKIYNAVLSESNSHNEALIRFPQGLSNDIIALRKFYADNAGLIRDVIIFLNKCTNRDLFGGITFDLSEFAKIMGYDESNLRRTREEFREIDSKKIENKNLQIPEHDGHIFDGRLEYVLYNMLYHNLVFENSYKGRYSGKSIQLLSSLNIEYDPTNPRSKRKYTVSLSPFLLNSYFQEYSVLDFDDYRKLGIIQGKRNVEGIKSLYILLIRGLNLVKYKIRQKAAPVFITSVDEVANVLGIDLNAKTYKKKQLVTKALDKFSELEKLSIKYTYVPINGDNRFKYGIEIRYSKESIEYHQDSLYNNFLMEVKKNLDFAADRIFHITVRDAEQFHQSNEYANWFYDKNADIEVKYKIIYNAVKDVYKVNLNMNELKEIYENGLEGLAKTLFKI